MLDMTENGSHPPESPPTILKPEEVKLRIELFRTFVEQYGDALIGFAFRKCRNPHRAEDAVQEVFTRMTARLADPTFILVNQAGFPVNLGNRKEVHSAMRGYITRSVGRQLIDMSRKRANNDTLLSEDTPHPSTEEDGYGVVDRSDTFEKLQAHLANATQSTKNGVACMCLLQKGIAT